jgi:hypothetical protein
MACVTGAKMTPDRTYDSTQSCAKMSQQPAGQSLTSVLSDEVIGGELVAFIMGHLHISHGGMLFHVCSRTTYEPLAA